MHNPEIQQDKSPDIIKDTKGEKKDVGCYQSFHWILIYIAFNVDNFDLILKDIKKNFIIATWSQA